MPHIPFEAISNAEYNESFKARLRMDQLEADKIYTFHGHVKGLAAQAITTSVRLSQIEMVERSDDLRAVAQLYVLDDDFQVVEKFDSHLVHGLWTPDKRKNVWNVMRRFFRSEVQIGYFTHYDDVDWSSFDPALDTSVLPDLDPELVDA